MFVLLELLRGNYHLNNFGLLFLAVLHCLLHPKLVIASSFSLTKLACNEASYLRVHRYFSQLQCHVHYLVKTLELSSLFCGIPSILFNLVC
jgi:hypothetical protein